MSAEEQRSSSFVTAIRWNGDAATGTLELLDQRLLPNEETWMEVHTSDAAAEAIRSMVVRGAPAIGLTAAYGVVLAAQEFGSGLSLDALESSMAALQASRPTAVNLYWALERMRRVFEAEESVTIDRLFEEAEAIRAEDIEANLAMGQFGAELLGENVTILTHCNTGSLATAGYGTALGVIRSAHEQGKLTRVYAGETRPYLQGSRLTMWELMKDGIPSTLVSDNMPAYLMQQKDVQAVIVGADRIAANGDTANKIGTYGLAVLARHHGIPFYIAAPMSTVDLETNDGSEIPIEERSSDEVTVVGGVSIAPEGAQARHPAFDVTPGELITAIITERGVVKPPYRSGLAALAAQNEPPKR